MSGSDDQSKSSGTSTLTNGIAPPPKPCIKCNRQPISDFAFPFCMFCGHGFSIDCCKCGKQDRFQLVCDGCGHQNCEACPFDDDETPICCQCTRSWGDIIGAEDDNLCQDCGHETCEECSWVLESEDGAVQREKLSSCQIQ